MRHAIVSILRRHCCDPALPGPAIYVCAALAGLVLATAVTAATDISGRPATQPLAQAAQAGPQDRRGQITDGIDMQAVQLTMPPTATLPDTRPVVPPTQPAVSGIADAPEVASELDTQPINRNGKSAAPATQATAPVGGGGNGQPTTSYDVGRVAMSLVAVIALILFLKWGSKKVFALPSTGTTGVMHVVSRTALAPRQQLLLVRVGRRLMVIGDSAGRLTGIGEIVDPDEVASLLGQTQATPAATGGAVSFTGMFRRFRAARQQPEADWDEPQRDSAVEPVLERSGRLEAFDRRDALMSADDSDDDDVQPQPAAARDADEADAQNAVEAARYDIQALRAKLREVTGRLTESPDGEAGGIGRA